MDWVYKNSFASFGPYILLGLWEPFRDLAAYIPKTLKLIESYH